MWFAPRTLRVFQLVPRPRGAASASPACLPPLHFRPRQSLAPPLSSRSPVLPLLIFFCPAFVRCCYIELMIFEQPPFWEERFEHFKWTNVLFINREWLDAIDGMKSVGEGGGGWTFNRQDALRECSPGLNKISKARPTM